MILRKSRDNDPVFNFIMGAMVIGIDALLLYLKMRVLVIPDHRINIANIMLVIL